VHLLPAEQQHLEGRPGEGAGAQPTSSPRHGIGPAAAPAVAGQPPADVGRAPAAEQELEVDAGDPPGALTRDWRRLELEFGSVERKEIRPRRKVKQIV
jgi:hypothetical protein